MVGGQMLLEHLEPLPVLKTNDMLGLDRCANRDGGLQFRRGLRWFGAKRSEEHTSELPSLMRIPYADICLEKKNKNERTYHHHNDIHSSATLNSDPNSKTYHSYSSTTS